MSLRRLVPLAGAALALTAAAAPPLAAPAQVQVAQVQGAQIQVAQVQVAQIQVAQIQVAQIQVAQIQVAQVRVAQIQVAQGAPVEATNVARIPGVNRTSLTADGAGADVVPVLTSTPFGVLPGQRVTHTIALSVTGTGVVAGVRVSFTTSVGLEPVTATASVGRCPTVEARAVVCELGDLARPATVRVEGVLSPGTGPGALVSNVVTVSTNRPDSDPTDNRVSNAYLLPAPTAASSSPAPSARPGTVGSRPVRSGRPMLAALAALAAGIVAALVPAGLLLRRRRSALTSRDTTRRETVV